MRATQSEQKKKPDVVWHNNPIQSSPEWANDFLKIWKTNSGETIISVDENMVGINILPGHRKLISVPRMRMENGDKTRATLARSGW